MGSVFGVRRRTRRFIRAGLGLLRDAVDARIHDLDERRERRAKRPPEGAASEEPARGQARARRRRAAG